MQFAFCKRRRENRKENRKIDINMQALYVLYMTEEKLYFYSTLEFIIQFRKNMRDGPIDLIQTNFSKKTV